MADEKKLVKIRLEQSVSGIGFDGHPFTFAAGQEVEVESRLAADLCRGNAVLVIPPTKENAASKQKPEIR